jgi:pimeloyl-ACP methyl ester carboxylesterase
MTERLLAASTRAHRPDVVAAVERMMYDTPPGTLVAALQGLAARPDARPQLPGIGVPVLVLGGEEDQVTPPDVLTGLAAAIPGAQLRLLPAAGHVANLEAAPAFNQALHAFLAGLPPA